MDKAVPNRGALIVRHSGVTVLTLVDEVDIATAESLRTALGELLDERPTTLVLDLRRIAFLGSSGISVLVGAVHLADELGVRLAVTTTKLGVLRALEVTDLVAVHPRPPESLVPKPRAGAEFPSAVRPL